MSVINRRKALSLSLGLAAVVALSACDVMKGRETAGQYVDDTAITTSVKAKMIEDPKVEATQVNVETMKGVVQLSGFVDSRDTLLRAEQIARNVSGVRGVKNELILRQ